MRVVLSTRHNRHQDRVEPPPPWLDEPGVIRISATAAQALAHRPRYDVFSLWVQEIGPQSDPPLQAYAISSEGYEHFLRAQNKTDKSINVLAKLPKDYHDLAGAFSRETAKVLPPHKTGVDHEIKLKPESDPPYQKGYHLSARENDAIGVWVESQLNDGLIRRGSSAAASPVIVVRKPGGGIRVCVDNRALNALKIKNRHPIPLVRDTLGRIGKPNISPSLTFFLHSIVFASRKDMSGLRPSTLDMGSLNALLCHSTCATHRLPFKAS